MNQQIADALALGHERSVAEKSTGVNEQACLVVSLPMRADISRAAWVGAMFGDTPRRKILCSCGAIADFDSAMASRKRSLGKAVECRACRNERISHEMEDLNAQFLGLELERTEQTIQ